MSRRTEPKPKLKPGVIYYGDNGRRLCRHLHCAGVSALTTGRDLSGHRVVPAKYAETIAWHAEFGKPLSCECGRTTYLLPCAS